MKPRKDEMLPTVDRLKRLISYCPVSGEMTWKIRPETEFKSNRYPASRIANLWNKQWVGKRCGCDNGSGYIVTRIDGISIKAHRIAFAIHHSRWPVDMIDHINGIKSDNRISNLREVTRSQNLQNQRVRKGTSNFKGVTWDKGMKSWLVQIRLDKVNRRVGFFANEVDAARAYDEAAANLFGEFARLNFPTSGSVSALE